MTGVAERGNCAHNFLGARRNGRARASNGDMEGEESASDGLAQAHHIGRRELFDRVWSNPMTTNAAELGTTTASLSALAKRLGLPLPRSGHWMKKEVGKAPPTPDYPVDPRLDEGVHSFARSHMRHVAPAAVKTAGSDPSAEAMATDALTGDAAAAEPYETHAEIGAVEHKKVASTRAAIRKARSADRVSIGGRGKFRLLVGQASGERACSILDRLLAAVEAMGWSLDATEQGHAIVADGETAAFMIEEKLDRVPHVITAAETREKADYDRKCALADRGKGWRPWGPPKIPEYDYVPNGDLVLKFDHDYAAGGTRRTFSDGKRRRLEDAIPSIIESLERRAAAVKARREERAQWERDWAEQERRRKDRERQARVEGYRIVFLQRQIERKREVDGLSNLIAAWDAAGEVDTKFAELLEFARLYLAWLEARIAPPAIAQRVAELKLMDDDVYIYDAKRLD